MKFTNKNNFNNSVPIYSRDILESSGSSIQSQQFKDLAIDENKPIVDGYFSVTECPSGLVIHCNDTIARHDFEMEFVAPAGLTIMIVLNGKPDIKLDNEPMMLDDFQSSDGVTAILWSSNRSVTVRRRMKKKERLKKINISLGANWVENWNKVGALATGGFLESLTSTNKLIQWQPSERIVRNATEIIRDERSNSLIGKLLAEGCAIEILREAIGLFDNTPNTSKISVRSNIQIRKIDAYIEKNLSRDITLDTIATEVGMSISSMQRVFKRSYGITVRDSIRQKRLEQARVALLIDGVTVAHASQMAGYKNLSNFTNAFKKHFGTLPSHMRA